MIHFLESHPATSLARKSLVMALLLPCLCGLLGGCASEESSRAAEANADRQDMSDARADFEDVFREWTRMLRDLHELEVAFHAAPASKREELFKEHFQTLTNGYSLEDELLSAAMRAYSMHPQKNADLKEFLLQIASMLVQAECYEDGLKVSQMLLDSDVDELAVYQNAADAAFACSKFDVAEQCLRIIDQRKGNSTENSRRLALMDVYKKEWKKEQELRETERLANDLPRVLLVTVRGEIELELFENEAPNTVANFIKLVEDGFYDGLTFHEVKPGVGAFSGCPLGDGTGSPGHFIRHEFEDAEPRVHFRGSLSTISEGPFANGSQFCITFLPTPQREGLSTVFGRVIRGMDVLARLQRRGGDSLSASTPPDRIITAKVVRKRDHPYKPDRIPDPTAEQRKERAEFMQKMLSR
ncbi:MAG: peptidylprolyl isomerase [Planctomycetota bacterium]